MSTGELVPDTEYDGMFRVRLPDGELSDMVNRQRATELSRLLVREEQRVKWANKGKVA